MKIGISKSIGATSNKAGYDLAQLKKTLTSPQQSLLAENYASPVNTTTDETWSGEFDAVETSIEREKTELDSFDLQNSAYDISNISFNSEESPVKCRKYQSTNEELTRILEKKYKKYNDSFCSEDQNQPFTYSKRRLGHHLETSAENLENEINRVDTIKLTLDVSDMKNVESSVKQCLTEKELDCYKSSEGEIRFYELQRKLKRTGLKPYEVKDYLKNHVPSLDLSDKTWILFYNRYLIESTKEYDEKFVKKLIKKIARSKKKSNQ